MKTLLLTLNILLFTVLSLSASNPAYEKAMKKEIMNLEEAKDSESFVAIANSFSRISEMNPKEWLPLYYQSLALVNAGFTSKNGMNEQDDLFDRAYKLTQKAGYLSQGNSEIIALEGYIIMGKLSVDPVSRGQSLSPQAYQLFGKALGINSNNPRALILMAQMEQGTAAFFGRSNEKACQYAQGSLQLFDKEAQENDEANILPRWGREMAVEMVESCNTKK